MKTLLLVALFFPAIAQAEITLTIKRADGSVYWVDHFNDQAKADRWLADEKTRPYWKQEYTAAFVDNSPSAADLAAQAAAKAQADADAKALKDALRAADVSKVQDPAAKAVLATILQALAK